MYSIWTTVVLYATYFVLRELSTETLRLILYSSTVEFMYFCLSIGYFLLGIEDQVERSLLLIFTSFDIASSKVFLIISVQWIYTASYAIRFGFQDSSFVSRGFDSIIGRSLFWAKMGGAHNGRWVRAVSIAFPQELWKGEVLWNCL